MLLCSRDVTNAAAMVVVLGHWIPVGLCWFQSSVGAEVLWRIRSVLRCEFSMSLITTSYVGFIHLQPWGEKLTPFLHVSKAFVLGHT